MVTDGTETDHDQIRAAMVFFDVFDFPCSTVAVTDPTTESLASLGLLSESQLSYNGDGAAAARRTAFDAYLAWDATQKGAWSIARSVQQLGIPPEELVHNRAFSIDLHNALPVFSATVPLDAILEFKSRHQDELSALRAHLEQICSKVSANGYHLDGTPELASFSKAINDYMTVMMQSNWEKTVQSLRQTCNWTDGLAPAAGALADLATGGWSAVLPGVLAGGVSIAVKTAKGLHSRDVSSPFEYLTSVTQRLY